MDCRTHGAADAEHVWRDTIKNFFSLFPTQSLIWDCTTWRSTSTPISSALRDRRTYQCIVSYPAIAK